jgi:Ser/Thr protein kinase RdoA (MazF antagonist)
MDQTTIDMLQAAYDWKDFQLVPVHTGLINATWKIESANGMYLLQRINTQVFKQPENIDANLQLLHGYLQQHEPAYLFTAPVKAGSGSGLVYAPDGVYRAFNWVNGSHTVDVAVDSAQAFEAAGQFGKFTALLDGFDARQLQITLPDFHNLALRYQQFMAAANDGIESRRGETAGLIRFLQSQNGIVERYLAFTGHPEARIRVTHHDTKISNVLFDGLDKGICVIDLDTVMPGYFLSDVGDMFRTYTCPVSEEEKDLDLIKVRKNFVAAIREGYLKFMQPVLSRFEQDHLYFGGEILIYMQALRFLTDYLQNDSYYGSKYPGQNLVRARNQARLLGAFQEAIR